jgi:hypothetical protein
MELKIAYFSVMLSTVTVTGEGMHLTVGVSIHLYYLIFFL